MQRRQANETGQAFRSFVYGLVDPRTGEIRYIGRTCRKLETRLSGHISARHQRYAGGSKAKRAWINELIDAGLKPTIRALETFDSELDALEAEGRWIKKGMAEGWPLTNRQKSGRGMVSRAGREERIQRRFREWAEARRRNRRWQRENAKEEYVYAFKGPDLRALKLAARLLGTSTEDAANRLLFGPAAAAFDRALSDLIKRRHELLREKPQAASIAPGAA